MPATIHGVAESDTTERLHFHFLANTVGRGSKELVPLPVPLPD